MYYKRAEDGDEQEDIENNLNNFADQLEKQTVFHTKKILEEDAESVEQFLNEITRLMLEQVNQVEDDDVALDLTTLITTALGGIGTALLELKEENHLYKSQVIDYIAKKQNPETN
tara:strand:- start:110 stop:454 length:345 start_codon:yes stop_codon:yes gene_type:complete